MNRPFGRPIWERLKLVAACLLALPTTSSAIAQEPEWVAIPVSPAEQLAEQRRLTAALASLKPQRPGVVDAYVIVAALDSDPVFGREAREAGRVFERRFDASGRTIVLAADEGPAKAGARGSPHSLALALAQSAELMDRNEDVLVLYTTGHGVPDGGLTYRDRERGAGLITPRRLGEMLRSLGVSNRLIILQACYSGQFVPALAGTRTIVATAAAADRASFGCRPGNDWTLFGDGLINHAMRRPGALADQLKNAAAYIAAAEAKAQVEPSNPQVRFGSETAKWLGAIESRAPRTATQPVGRPVTAETL